MRSRQTPCTVHTRKVAVQLSTRGRRTKAGGQRSRGRIERSQGPSGDVLVLEACLSPPVESRESVPPRASGFCPGELPVFRSFAALLLSLAVVAHAADRLPAENARIEYLISIIAALSDAQFIRNGKAYDNKAAVDHVREKLRFAGSRVRTAEDFIRDCASVSSLSRKPYEIRFSDGRMVPAAQFLQEKLQEFDRQNRRQ